VSESSASLEGEVEDVIRGLDASRNLNDVFVVLSKWLKPLGFNHFTYWLLTPPEGPRRTLYVSNYPAHWLERHTVENYASHDYVGRFAARSVLPFLWGSLQERHPLTKTQKLIFYEATSVGLASGGTVPIHGPGAAKAAFSVANGMLDREFAALFFTHRHELHLVAMYAHEKILSFNLHNPRLGFTLSPRETEALTWIAKGKTRWEVGSILGISEETVKVHLEHARKKLGSSNTTHAVAVALLNGLLLP